jgi:hypothetical protein
VVAVSDADDEVAHAILVDIRAAAAGAPDQSIRKIAARYNVSTRKVRTIARDHELGDAWSHRAEHTAAATQARVVEMRARRFDLADRLLEETEELLDHLHSPHMAFSFGGRDNTYNEHLLERPPASDIRNYVQAAGKTFEMHLAAMKHDTHDGSEAATSLIGQLATGLTAAYEELKRQEAGGEGVGDDDPEQPEP